MISRRTSSAVTLFIIFFISFAVFAFDLNDVNLEKAVTGGTKLVQAAAGLSDEDEMAVGREVAANLAARYGFVESPTEVRYINLVGQAVVKHCERKTIPYHFGILHTAEINALAAPGGYIFVTQGLLESLQDESELAGVLAHEITHVVRRHIAKAIRQANLVEGSQDLAEAAGKNVEQFSQLSDFSINLLSKGLSREDELEADKFGTLLAAQVGYDITGLRRSIEGLASKQQSDLFLAHFNKTHPPASERLSAIDKILPSTHSTLPGARLSERFTKNIRKS